jgi:hypothetical protein
MKATAHGAAAPRRSAKRPANRQAKRPANESTEAPYLSIAQLCDLAQSLTGKRPSPSTASRWLHKGAGGCRLPSHKVGGNYYILRTEALRWLGALPSSQVIIGDRAASAAVAAQLGKAWGGVTARKAAR